MDREMIGKGFHVLAKPYGPVCNLDCRYCFYTEKEIYFSDGEKKYNYCMSDEVLEAFIKKYIEAQEIPEIQFVWQGGEPLVAGLDFYRKALSYQKKYANGKSIVNSIQTNGTLLDDGWCPFLKENNFFVGISIDGPKEIHDRYRVDRGGKSTYDKVVKGIELLKKYDIPYNLLACVTRESSQDPLTVYNELKKLGNYIQFSPIVERMPYKESDADGLVHASPGAAADDKFELAPYSVESESYGDFLIAVFEEWVRNDVGEVYVMNFEWALESWMGLDSTICIFAEECGRAVTIEHNGDVYSCDHFVYPEYRLGNIMSDDPDRMVESDVQKNFGKAKSDLPRQCRDCSALFACKGECPKNRFMTTADGEPGLNYLCDGYYRYFRYIHRYMKAMVQLIESGLPAANIKDVIKGPQLYMKE